MLKWMPFLQAHTIKKKLSVSLQKILQKRIPRNLNATYMFARFGRNDIFNFHTVVLDNYSIFRLDTIKYHHENGKSVTYLHRMIIQTFWNLTLCNGDLLNYFNKTTNTVEKPKANLTDIFREEQIWTWANIMLQIWHLVVYDHKIIIISNQLAI